MKTSVTDKSVLARDWQDLIESLPGVVYRLEANSANHFRFTYISPIIKDWFGFDPADLAVDAQPLLACIHPEDIEGVLGSSEHAASNGSYWHQEFRMLKSNQQEVWLEAYDRGHKDAYGNRVWTGYLNDTSERKELEKRVQASEALFRGIVENANDIIFTLTANGQFQYLSPNWHEQMGYQVHESASQTFDKFVHPDDIEICRTYLQQVLGNPDEKIPAIEYRVLAADGSIQWHTSNGTAVTDPNGHVLYFLGIARDITEAKLARDKLAHMARYDLLTGLPNRAHFQELLELQLKHANNHSKALAVLFIDLDKFKPINDCHGHAVGDSLLKIVAQRIQRALRDHDVAGRIGGDEFTALLNGFERDPNLIEAEAKQVAERIRHALEQPIHIDELHLEVSASIGVALYPYHAEQLGDLMRQADQAMYNAKAAGRNCVHVCPLP
ncbi:diguanylate cyclase domain-containing protein [Pseudidiomarina fusca]|uniref:diguanylate cyclase domain-containing protein n=1 Tax=Pseudidiomarina fusca TaxID=2965078 RepID=UPI0028C40EA9|nr:diguanylate cyclase [Pseudidiomarina sp. GXY010]